MNRFKAALDIILKGIEPSKNQLNRALYEMRMFPGTVTYPSDTPDAYLKEGYAGNSDTYSIINRIDQMRKQAKLKLYKRITSGEEREEVTEHELNQFLERVNPSMYTDDYVSGFLIYRLVIGNVFTYYPKFTAGVNSGKTGEILLMPSNDVEIISGGWMEPVRGYKLESTNQEFGRDEVYHSKFFNPLFGTDLTFYGQSPLLAARRILAKQNEAELTELKQFENQGPPYMLYRDSAPDPVFNIMKDEQRNDMENRIKDHANSSKRGLPFILKEKFGVIDLGHELASLNILESSREGRRALCNIYGLPPALFGDTAGSTYNNMKTARKAAWTDCIIPNLKSVENAFNSMLISGVPAYKDLFFAYDYSEVEELQEGMEIKVSWMRQAGWTKNEIRQATGKYPVQQPIMDEPLFLSGETPMSQMTFDSELGTDQFGDYGTT